MTDNPQPEALRLALSISLMDTFTNYQQEELGKAAAELRRQHTRIAELELQLVQRFNAADMATAAARGFRDGAASAMAGEPMAWMTFTEEGDPDMVFLDRLEACQYCEDDDPPKPLYLAAPPTAQAEGWTKLPGQLPEPGMPVLLDIGKKYPIRAMWAAKFTLPVSLEDDSGFGEHDERTDEWYCPEGWYEWNEFEETHWAVSETPRAWMPLPPTSAEGVEHAD